MKQKRREGQQQQLSQESKEWRSTTTTTTRMGKKSTTYGKKTMAGEKNRSMHNFECFSAGQQHYATFLSTHTYRERKRERGGKYLLGTLWHPFFSSRRSPTRPHTHYDNNNAVEMRKKRHTKYFAKRVPP